MAPINLLTGAVRNKNIINVDLSCQQNVSVVQSNHIKTVFPLAKIINIVRSYSHT